MLVDEIPRGSGNPVLGNTDMKVIVPQCLRNRTCLGDINGELFDYVSCLIIHMPVRTPVGNGNNLGKYPVLLQGFDEF